jgi:capsid protein
MEMVDPSREIPAVITAIRAGLLPPQRAIGELGENWRETVQSYAEWFAALDAAKLVFDTDPRQTAGSGAAQPDYSPGDHPEDPTDPQPPEPPQ